MLKFIALCLVWLSWSAPAFAVGSIIATAVLAQGTAAWIVSSVAFAINMVASMVISKLLAPDIPNGIANQQPNPGNRQQLPPAGDNKIPVVYGSAYTGGIITDMSISQNNQDIYWVISLCEVTNTESGGTPDEITFGNVYWGGKKVIFSTTAGQLYKVTGLQDESTGEIQDVAGYMDIWLYKNGSSNPANSSTNAISVMSTAGLEYTWDGSKLMSNCAFAIVHIKYSQSRNLTGLSQTRFQVTNSRTNTGDCFLDYFTSTRYGAAIPLANIDTTSLTALTTYSNETITYNLYSGGTATMPRFKFNGTLDTNLKIMQNIQAMADCCDCLVKYNEITGLWGVIVQKPTNTIVMDINDSNMISAITVTPIDISNSFNIIEVKFPDGSAKDSFNSATFDLAVINPSLLFPNEPVNKQSVNLYLVNNSVTAQLIANRFLEAAREDLQINVEINYIGLQLEAGDIVTVTNANYGWVAKEFRIMKVTEKFSDSGQVTATLQLMEFNGTVYDDANITQFTPAPNTGIGSPVTFGYVPPPTIANIEAGASTPYFGIQVTTASSGITQYAEIWYSAYQYPTESQRIFAGTTEVQANGDPYDVNTAIPIANFYNFPAGKWYFFSRMVNSIASSPFSLASTALNWKPTTLTFTQRYLSVAYANDVNGTDFSLNPRNKTYFGLYNSSSNAPNLVASNYTWYPANPVFSTNQYLLFVKRNNRAFSFAQGLADYAAGTATFVPTQTSTFDPSIWSGLPDGFNIIDLDMRTGQLTGTGTTTVGTGEIQIVNNSNGTIIAALQQYLDFGGPYTKTVNVAQLTIDIYGRVVGFAEPDAFYYSENTFIATAGQTVFSVTRGSGYILDQCLVFRDGLLLNEDEYVDASSSVTLATGANLYDAISIISFKSENATSGVYASFTRNTATLTNQTSYTASGFTLVNGYELLFLNGAIVCAEDYNISGQTITFINNVTGDLQIIQWSQNNLGVANGTPVNADVYTVIGQTTYPFTFTPSAFNLYSNGVLLVESVDFTIGTNQYTLSLTPYNNTTILTQQTFSRTGAV